jgi:L-threonylcarbamoyladenylate synthase
MEDFSEDIEGCLMALHGGEVILYPTDTIWGLGCDATNSSAVKKLMAIKGKPMHQGLIVLLAAERDVLQYVAAPDLAVFDYLATTIKPTTVIYEAGLNVADDILNSDGSIAIRLVKDEFCRYLIKRFRKPIVSTSANLHGQPSPQNFSHIPICLKNEVKYIVKIHQQDENKINSQSSIIKWTNGNPELIRG